MALPQPKAFFGINKVTIVDRNTGIQKFVATVIGEASMNSNLENVELEGGSYLDPVQVERGRRTNEFTLTLKETHPELMAYLAGVQVVKTAAEPNGSVTTIFDKFGTTIVDATTGIASVGLESGQADKLWNSRFTVVAVSATTVNVYASTVPNDWYVDDTNKINVSPLTITSGGNTIITNALGNKTGLQLVGGSGSIAFTTGHTGVFQSFKPNKGRFAGVVGRSSDVYKDFTIDLDGTEQASGRNYLLRVYKVTPPGLSMNATPLEFAENQVTMKASYDAAAEADGATDGVWKMEYIDN